MSFNFTGSTGRRNVNLGNRSLARANKSAFLKTAQQERLNRENARIREKAAIVLQNAFRRNVELMIWRKKVRDEWDGASVSEFNFFFPTLFEIQSLDQSKRQISNVMSHIQEMSVTEINVLLKVLIEPLCDPTDSELFSNYFPIAITNINQIVNLDKPLQISSHLQDKFTEVIVGAYCAGDASMLYYILTFTQLINIDKLFPMFTNLDTNMFNVATEGNYQAIFLAKEVEILERMLISKICIISLPDDEKLKFTSYLSCALQRLHNPVIPNIVMRMIPMIFQSISLQIIKLKDNSVWGNSKHAKIVDSKIAICNSLFEDISFFFNKKHVDVPADFQSEYISALLHFAALIEESQENLTKTVTLDWIIDADETMILHCCNKIIQTITPYVSQNNITLPELTKLIDSKSNKAFWQNLVVLQEFLGSIISFTPDNMFFSKIKITLQDFETFVSFLRLFISQVLIKYRDINPTSDPFFISIFKKLLALNHALYTKNITLKFVEQNFWILSSFDVEFGSITSTLPLIDSIHQHLMVDEYTGKTTETNDFLKSTMFMEAFKTVPKNIVDTYYILTYASYMIPFEKRAELFHAFIEYDKRDNDVNGWYPTKVEGTVCRDNLLFDAYKSFGHIRGKDFKKPFSVQFINQFGEAEAGIDGGGLTKELLTSLVDSAFVPSEENRRLNRNLQFFKLGTDYKLYFNPEFFFKRVYEEQNKPTVIDYGCSDKEYLDIAHFLGMVIGKCLYDNVLLDVSFASFFLSTCSNIGGEKYRNLLGDKVDFLSSGTGLGDIRNMDESMFTSLVYILNQTDDEKFSQMCLEFAVDDEFYDLNNEKYHARRWLQSNPDNHSIPVTAANKMQFVRSMIHFKLNVQSRMPMSSFVDGLFNVIKPHWLLLFDSRELQTLISGDGNGIDLEDLRKNVAYGGGYSANDKTVQYLFEVLAEFDKETVGKFIKFVTSSSKKPLLGFKELTPKFGIFKAGNDSSRLPTASTCVNLLKLPDYKDKEHLRKKLLYSINSKAGFDLS